MSLVYGAATPGRRAPREPPRRKPPPTRVLILAAESAAEADGIRDYTNRLATELHSHGTCHVEVRLRTSGERLRSVVDSGGADVLLVQYNPFCYGRWGFAPSLPLALWRLKRRSSRPVMALMVHETFVAMKNWRWALMGAWQRAQLLALQPLADIRFCSIEVWSGLLRRMWPPTPVHHLPVASNFPDMRRHRAEQRAAMGLSEDAVVLACFGMSHPGRLQEHIVKASEAVAGGRHDVALLNLGVAPNGATPLAGSIDVHAPGYLDHESTARLLSAADIFLAPYADGVSTRRTTVMSALQHGLPVVGTRGHLTDDVLAEARHAIELVPVGSPGAFAKVVRELAEDPARRRALGHAGRTLYETHFDWPVLTSRLLTALEASRGGP